EAADGIMHAMAQQTRTAIAEADAVIFMVDGREGLIADDRAIADMLRRSGRPIVLAVNKCEGLAPENATAEFHELGLGTPIAISAAHGENVRELAEAALALCGEDAAAELQEDADQGAARDRGCQRRRAGARRTGWDRRARRSSCRLHRRGGTCAGCRGQQMGRSALRSARRYQAGSRSQAGLPCLCANPHDLGARW